MVKNKISHTSFIQRHQFSHYPVLLASLIFSPPHRRVTNQWVRFRRLTFSSQTPIILMTYTHHRSPSFWHDIFVHWFGTFPGFQRLFSSRTFWRFSVVTWPFRTVIHTRPGILHCLRGFRVCSRDIIHCPNRIFKSFWVKINVLFHSFIFLSLNLLNSFDRYWLLCDFGGVKKPLGV